MAKAAKKASAKASSKPAVKASSKAVAKSSAKPAAKASKAAPKKETPKPKVAKAAEPKAKPAPKATPIPAKAEKKLKVVPDLESEDEAIAADLGDLEDIEIEEVEAVAPVKVKAPKKTKASAAKAALVAEESRKWIDMKEKYGADKAPAYSMSGVYEANTGLQHKVLGWGYIVSVQNDRLEVLFEEGSKILISNYKR